MIFQLIIGLSAGFCCPSNFYVPSLDDYHRHSPSSFSPPSNFLRIPSLVDYRRHSSRAWPPSAYAFILLSTIGATLPKHRHPPLSRSFSCRLSAPLFQSIATLRFRVPSLVDYRRHSSKAWPPSAYAFLLLSTIGATLRVRSVIHKIRHC